MKRNQWIFLAVLAVALLPSCSKEEPLPTHQASGATAAADPGTVTPLETPAATTTTAAAVPTTPPAATANPGAIVASTDSEWPGITLNVTELKRGSGGTLMLKVSVTNGSAEELGTGYDFGDTSMGGTDYSSVGGIHLIDPVGKKKYFVVRDADSKCVCSRGIKSLTSGARANWWAKFPAPPPDVRTVTVIVPHFTPMDDVPIS